LTQLQPLSEETWSLFDVKQEIYRVPDRFLYSLGLHYGIQGESSWDIVDQLHTNGIIGYEASLNLKKAVTFATTLDSVVTRYSPTMQYI